MGREDGFRPPERTNAVREPEKEAAYVVVEIGAGEEPLPAALGLTNSYRRRIHDNPNMQYVALDSDPERLRSGQNYLASMDRIRRFDPNERIRFELQEGENLRFESGSVAEIVLRNVLGDMDVEEHTKKTIIAEAARVLKPGGTLKIIEQISPLARPEVLALVAASSGGVFVSAESNTISEEDRKFDEEILELKLHPFAFVLRLQRKPLDAGQVQNV